MKKKSKIMLILILLIAICSITFWSYKAFMLTKTIDSIVALNKANITQLQIKNIDDLKWQDFLSTIRLISTYSIWLSVFYGFMIAMSFVLIYTEIKKFREPISSTDG